MRKDCNIEFGMTKKISNNSKKRQFKKNLIVKIKLLSFRSRLKK